MNRSNPAQSWRRLGTIPTGCVLVCILQATQLTGSAKCESPSGVEFEIILDSDSVKFPDPIYGFLRVTNTSGREDFFPSLGELQHSTSLELRCGEQVVEADFAPNQPPRATRRPAGYSSVTSFCLRYKEPKFVQRVRERLLVLIHAKTPVRPRQIANSVVGRDTADRTSAPRFVWLSESNGRPILSATAETRVRVDPDNWISRRPDDPLIRFAAAWPAWRSDRELGEMTRLMKFPQSTVEIERFDASDSSTDASSVTFEIQSVGQAKVDLPGARLHSVGFFQSEYNSTQVNLSAGIRACDAGLRIRDSVSRI